MKLKFLALCIFSCLAFASAAAFAADDGLRHIRASGMVRCGTDASAGLLAYKDKKNKRWEGFDAGICRAVATAAFGKPELFEMVDVRPDQAGAALANNKIDIMLGQVPMGARAEITGRTAEAALLYYDRQMLLARARPEARSLKDYQGVRACAVTASGDYDYLREFSDAYSLDWQMLFYPTMDKAKEAFLTKRCEIFSGSEIYLKSILESLGGRAKDYRLIPEVIAVRPIYALTSRENLPLKIVVKWVVNALLLAESRGISAQTADIFSRADSLVVRNLLGFDDALWKGFGLKPDWVGAYIRENGNYGELYEKTLGAGSKLDIPRKENNLLDRGGMLISAPFI